MVEVESLVKIFPAPDGGDKRAVDGVSFRVPRGEVYGLLGPNGAGKTTTLRILSGLISATSGTARIDGRDVHSDREGLKRSLGYLTASTGLYQRLSPYEILLYFGRLHGVEEAALRRRIAALSDWLDMGSFLHLRCGGLSTGQKQRASIARALVSDPPVLIMDEPTLGLDVLTNRVILEFIREEGNRGKTIILSTHYLDDAQDLCHRFGLLHQGRLIAEGNLLALRQRTGKSRLTDVFLTLCGESTSVLRAPAAGLSPAAQDADPAAETAA